MSTIVRTEKYQRGVFGTVFKWAFIAFNILMVAWLVTGMNSVSQMTANSDAARAGHAIGATIAFSMVLGIWMMGDIILGVLVLLTRGDKIVVEQSAYGNAGKSSQASFGSNADELIAQYKQELNTAKPPAPSTPARGAVGPTTFGKRS